MLTLDPTGKPATTTLIRVPGTPLIGVTPTTGFCRMGAGSGVGTAVGDSLRAQDSDGSAIRSSTRAIRRIHGLLKRSQPLRDEDSAFRRDVPHSRKSFTGLASFAKIMQDCAAIYRIGWDERQNAEQIGREKDQQRGRRPLPPY